MGEEEGSVREEEKHLLTGVTTAVDSKQIESSKTEKLFKSAICGLCAVIF